MSLVTGKDIFSDDLHIADVLSKLAGTPTASELHQARVLLKKLRARIRLLKKVQGDDSFFSQLDEDLRYLNKSLSGRRDAEVAHKTLNEFLQTHQSKKLTASINELLSIFGRVVRDEEVLPEALDEGINGIIVKLDRLDSIELEREKIQTYLLGQIRKCCDAGETALASQHCAELHDWRKRTKRIYYQLQAVTVSGKKLQRLIKPLDKLGKHLGLVHDYCFIRDWIDGIREEIELENNVMPTMKLLEKQKARQIRKAGKLQHKICHSGST